MIERPGKNLRGTTEKKLFLGIERTLWRTNIELSVAEKNINFEGVVDINFGTDSILEDQRMRRRSDARRALEIVSDWNDYRYIPEDNYALKMISSSMYGPITGFAELIESRQLSGTEILAVETAFAPSEVIKQRHGIIGYLAKRYRGERYKNKIDGLQFEYYLSFKFLDEPEGKLCGDDCSGSNSQKLEIGLNYVRKTLSFCRSYLTGGMPQKSANDLIMRIEAIPPEDRMAMFLADITKKTQGKIDSPY